MLTISFFVCGCQQRRTSVVTVVGLDHESAAQCMQSAAAAGALQGYYHQLQDHIDEILYV